MTTYVKLHTLDSIYHFWKWFGAPDVFLFPTFSDVSTSICSPSASWSTWWIHTQNLNYVSWYRVGRQTSQGENELVLFYLSLQKWVALSHCLHLFWITVYRWFGKFGPLWQLRYARYPSRSIADIMNLPGWTRTWLLISHWRNLPSALISWCWPTIILQPMGPVTSGRLTPLTLQKSLACFLLQ